MRAVTTCMTSVGESCPAPAGVPDADSGERLTAVI